MSDPTTTMGSEKCPVCGADIRSIDSFCWHCGHALRTSQPLHHQPQHEQLANQVSARFIVYTSTGKVVQEYQLDAQKVTIGRAPNNNILLSRDRIVSRHHATVYYEQNRFILYDEESANGTMINERPLQGKTPYILEDGDQVIIGDYRLVFRQP